MSTKKSAPAQAHPTAIVRDIRHATIGLVEKSVLFALTSRMRNTASKVWPSMPVLAEDSGAGRTATVEVVHWLESIGVLREVESKVESRTFKFDFERLKTLPEDIPRRTKGNRKRARGSRGEGEGVPGEGVRPAGEGVRPARSTPVPGEGDGFAGRGQSKREEKSEAKREVESPFAATLAPSPSLPLPLVADAPLTVDEQRVHDFITQDTKLSMLCRDVAALARQLVTQAGDKIDLIEVLRGGSKWLNSDDPHAANTRNGNRFLMKQLERALERALKYPRKASPPKPAPVVVDLAKHPELMPKPLRGARFESTKTSLNAVIMQLEDPYHFFGGIARKEPGTVPGLLKRLLHSDDASQALDKLRAALGDPNTFWGQWAKDTPLARERLLSLLDMSSSHDTMPQRATAAGQERVTSGETKLDTPDSRDELGGVL